VRSVIRCQVSGRLDRGMYYYVWFSSLSEFEAHVMESKALFS